MTWAKIDDKLHSDTKARKAGMPAMGLWVMCLSHCASHLTDGFVDDTDVEMIGGPGALDLAARLVKVGLWTRDSEREGYVFHNYLKYNPSAEEVIGAREQAKARRSRKKSPVVDGPASSERNANVGGTDSERNANVMRTSPDDRDTISLRTADVFLPRPDPTRPDPTEERAHTQGAREAVESTQTPPSLPAASSPVSAVRMTAQGEILAALQSHEALALVATARFAEQLEGRRMGKGSLVAWIVTAIDDAARDAGAEAAAGHPLSAPELAKLVSRFCDRARAPREPIADTRRGQGVAKRDGEQPPPLPPYYKPFQFEPRVKVTPEEAERRIRSLEALKPRSVREAEAEAARIKAANSVEPEEEAG